MKALIAIVVIVIVILAYALTRPVKKEEPPKQAPSTTEQRTTQASQPPAAPAQPPQKSKAGQIVDDVNSVINYGTGATAIKVKKNATQKLRDIQKTHNADLERELK